MAILRLAIIMIALSGCKDVNDSKSSIEPDNNAAEKIELNKGAVPTELAEITPEEPVVTPVVVPVPEPVVIPLPVLPAYASLSKGSGGKRERRCEKECSGFISDAECSGFVTQRACDGFVNP